MKDAELEDLAEKCGIYWVSENTAYMHANTMRAFAEALFGIERERCAAVCDALSAKAGRIRDATGSLEGGTGYECADAIRVA